MTDTANIGVTESLTPYKSIPDALHAELARMRRAPAGFSVAEMVGCKLGCGKAKAYSITHAECRDAGTWCAVHGWLSFQSAQLPPTERLRPSEIEDRKLAAQRKRGPSVKT